jgi:hypothetical protein
MVGELGRRYLCELHGPHDYEVSARRLRVCVIRPPPVGASLDLPNQGVAMRVWTHMRASSLVPPVAAPAATTVRVGGHE